MSIRAIETVYRGYRFRSRTEARWAVFFDALGLKWEYEVEGFELPSGRYLPDFRLHPELPTRGVWFEVKGVVPTASEINFLTELTDAQVDTTAIIGIGAPCSSKVMLRTPFCDEHRHQSAPWQRCALLKAILLADLLPFEKPSINRIRKAALSARSARFEFGENGFA
jgi:hypothetical protein